jgi:hypothetical protein
MRAFASSGPVQPDLLYMKSVLVSTGKNANDDVFLPLEMWKARATPNLKPVDWEHNTGFELIKTPGEELKDNKKIVADNQIIGVMHNSYVADKNGNTITEELARADGFQIPAEFDIINEAVIFKYIFPTVAARIIKEAQEGKLFVSMEAWFNGFDYRVGSKIVARNDETVFLDRFLRANGGVGIYQGQEVGRVLRNIVFGGVGIVARPANKDSVIQSFTNAELMENKNLDDAIVSHVIGTIGSKESQEVIDIMSEKAQENAPAAATLVDVVHASEYKDTVTKLVKAEAAVEAKTAELASAKAEIDTLKATIEKMSAEVETLVAGKVAAAEKAVSEMKLKLDAAEAKLQAIEAAKVVAERTQKVRDALNLSALATDADEMKAKKIAKADSLVKAGQHLDDAAFAAWIDELKEIVSLAAAPPWMNKDEDKKEEKKEEEEAKAEETDPAILDTVKATASIPAGNENPNPINLADKFKALAADLLTANKKTRFDYSQEDK